MVRDIYPFGRDCRIEFVTNGERERPPNISGWIIDLDDYEKVEGWNYEGGSGQVGLFRHRTTNEKVAIKSLPLPEQDFSEADLDRIQKTFMREISSLIELSHPCILDLKGCCLPTMGKGPKIVTEFLSCGSLKKILGSGENALERLSGNEKAIIIAGIVLGMIYIHSKGIIHRDLKPDNVFLDSEFRVKIGDFGSSREIDVTMTALSGTPLYMAPEVWDLHYDKKADVYSFGLILYEIVVGDGLFSNGSKKGRLFIDLQKGWRPPIPDEVSEVSKRLIEECWSEDDPALCRVR
jgi:serine/threonine protein kinase